MSLNFIKILTFSLNNKDIDEVKYKLNLLNIEIDKTQIINIRKSRIQETRKKTRVLIK